MEIDYQRYRRIKTIANKCFEKFLTRNPFKVLTKLNIPFRFVMFKGLDGFVIDSEKGGKQVFINKKYENDEYSARIIAAHELGHILLHINDELENSPNLFDGDATLLKEEYEADIFLMEFMPRIQPYEIDYINLSSEDLRDYIHSQLID